MKAMRSVQILGVILGLMFLVACETTDATGTGNQEAKRRVAIERRRQQPPPDEAQSNLLKAQENVLDRDTNPLRAY
jgi:hypothetical protein